MPWNSISKRTLRDPAGSLYEIDGRLIRFVKPEGISHAMTALFSPTSRAYFSDRSLAVTNLLTNPELLSELAQEEAKTNAHSRYETSGILLEHERISFVSFPEEWCPEMLWEAGRLTLDLALKFADEGLGLKDATPYNVLYRGPDPVFVDFLSIERRPSAQAVWLPFGQFTRTFLSPLLANRYFRLPIGMVFLNRRDGLEPEHLYPLCNWWQRFTQPFFSVVTVPFWLARFQTKRAPKDLSRKLSKMPPPPDGEKNKFILTTLLKYLRGLLVKVQPRRGSQSNWSGYTEGEAPYSKIQQEEKRVFLESVLKDLKPVRVLDVGCNTGFFSEMAAETGAEVVAIDRDEVCIGRLWRKARERKLNILPLVVDVARPTPALGWRNEETSGFLSRCQDHFDLTMWLAILHHLVYGDGIPVLKVLDLIADLSSQFVVLEFMEPEDISVKSITAHRGLVETISRDQFEHALAVKFDIIKSIQLVGGMRSLYLLAKRK
jgi:SAM-dependent methyltransferase